MKTFSENQRTYAVCKDETKVEKMSLFEKLGIVTNIWTKRMEGGDRFEDLARQFSDQGFKDMEMREGDYLRNSEFGSLIGEIEAAMRRYTDEQWKTICDAIWEGSQDSAVTAEDSALFARVSAFVEQARDLTLSFAMSHSWLSAPEDLEADNQQIIQAKKLAYLLCPANARLRIVGLAPTGGLDPQAAVANAERYQSLLPNCPMVFAVENSRQPATFTLDLAVRGGALLTYDEANTYRDDGTTLNPPEKFWGAVKMEDLTSVHFKQKTADGVLSQVGDGYVDFAAIGRHLVAGDYRGDLLLENTPTDQPLEDAIASRAYLSSLL